MSAFFTRIGTQIWNSSPYSIITLMESWKEKQVELSQSYELQVRLVYARIAYLS